MSTENKTAALAVDELEDGSATVALPDDESTQEAAEAGTEGATDERTTSGGADDQAGEEAAELAAATNDADREAIRVRRRQERAERRDRKNAAIRDHEELRAQVGQLTEIVRRQSEELNLVKRKTSGTELAQIDGAIKRASDAVAHYQEAIADAVTQQNGQVAADATNKMLDAKRALEQLTGLRRSATAPREEEPQPAAHQVDPTVAAKTRAWAAANTWFNPTAQTKETRLVRALDQAVSDDGYNPGTDAYWAELDRRVALNLPNRAKPDMIPDDDSVRKPGKSVVTGAQRSGSAAESGPRKTFTLSADRVKALKDAGMWDDPVSRSDAIQRFRKYDAEQASAKR